MRYHKVSWIVALGPALAVALAACGSSGTTTPKPSSPASTSAPAATAPAASSGSATAQITTNWQAFFNAKTPEPRRVQLLQNGQDFASIIKAQAGSTLASSATAQVTKVTDVSSSQAKVTYSILVGGTPELKDQAGVAVLQNGTWKVGDASFCGLLALENGGSTSGLPAACHSAS
jgi:hypothetical protein